MLSAQTASAEILSQRFQNVRDTTLSLIADLRPEDTVVQTMPDVSPTKWHLAHVTWFFERFVLEPYLHDYSRFDDRYHYLFNSYYNSVGDMHARPKRGYLSRPALADVLEYRASVDAAMHELLSAHGDNDELVELTTLGLNHEQQHQELLLTDIKHVFSCNPLKPAALLSLASTPVGSVSSYSFTAGKSGIQRIGAADSAFCFDNETPRHDALLQEHQIGNRLVTNGEYRAFIDDGAYSTAGLWLSDGWAVINERNWQRPLYWDEALETEFTLGGVREIVEDAPVCHVSYYEADAFARWAGARLPTEFEWESAVSNQPVAGNLLDAGHAHPVTGTTSQFFGDVWEWTSSAYAPYPGFAPLAGALGEYNGKFMCNQMTVRGGSCATSADHIRPTYRSFFYPDARWQFLGIRLAKDGDK